MRLFLIFHPSSLGLTKTLVFHAHPQLLKRYSHSEASLQGSRVEKKGEGLVQPGERAGGGSQAGKTKWLRRRRRAT